MHVLWGVVVLRVALRHLTTEAMLAELQRNEALRRIVGIESEERVPKKWNMSWFEEVLGQEPHRTLLKKVFDLLIQRLGLAIADLGVDTAGDATAPSARRKPEKAAEQEKAEGLSLACGGHPGDVLEPALDPGLGDLEWLSRLIYRKGELELALEPF